MSATEALIIVAISLLISLSIGGFAVAATRSRA